MISSRSKLLSEIVKEATPTVRGVLNTVTSLIYFITLVIASTAFGERLTFIEYLIAITVIRGSLDLRDIAKDTLKSKEFLEKLARSRDLEDHDPDDDPDLDDDNGKPEPKTIPFPRVVDP